jgi:hypothetical protein
MTDGNTDGRESTPAGAAPGDRGSDPTGSTGDQPRETTPDRSRARGLSRRRALASLAGLGGLALWGGRADATDASARPRAPPRFDVASASAFAHAVTFSNPDPDPSDRFGGDVAVSADGRTALVGVPGDDTEAGPDTGEAYVFARTGTGWNAAPAALSPPDLGPGDRFGESVSLSADGTTVLVGAPSDADAGEAYAFARTGTGWDATPAALPDPDPGGDGRFGESVCLSDDGTTALVGARDYRTEAGHGVGAAHVFARTEAGWDPAPVTLPNPRPAPGDRFGSDVAVSADGRTALVGAPLDEAATPGDDGPLAGVAYVFTRTEAGWDAADPAALANPDPDWYDVFGWSVAVSADGRTALVGAPENDAGDTEAGYGVGAAYVFARTEAGWDPTPVTLSNPDPDPYDYFGWDVALSADGTTALLDAFGGGADADPGGETYAFARTESGWATGTPLPLPDPTPDTSGSPGRRVAVDASGSAALVGAPEGDTDAGEAVGEAYLFERGSGGGGPSLVFEDQTSTGDAVVVAHATVPAGGFVVVASATGDTVYGVSEYLSPGSTADLRIPLDTPLPGNGTYLAVGQADTDGNRRFDADRVRDVCRLDVDGKPLADTAEITLQDC